MTRAQCRSYEGDQVSPRASPVEVVTGHILKCCQQIQKNKAYLPPFACFLRFDVATTVFFVPTMDFAVPRSSATILASLKREREIIKGFRKHEICI